MKALMIAGGQLWEARATGSVTAYRANQALLERCVGSFTVAVPD